jgi:hypothetical protein
MKSLSLTRNSSQLTQSTRRAMSACAQYLGTMLEEVGFEVRYYELSDNVRHLSPNLRAATKNYRSALPEMSIPFRWAFHRGARMLLPVRHMATNFTDAGLRI